MKLYENFEKAYKLLVNDKDILNFDKAGCDPTKIGEDKVVDEMIKFFQKQEDYEKCSTLLKIKCWRHNQDKKYNL
tara:strand:+ start:223 stop:447 length:225 start_codon:yes stop_codon:yes gene_type:complete